MIKKLFLTLVFSFICLFAYADTVTYYFNAYDSGGEEWANRPEKLVDGLTTPGTNSAYSDGPGDIELLTGNTCDGTNLGTITKVELRIYAVAIQEGGDYIRLRPVFGGGDGDNHNVGSLSYIGEWSSYFDITSDTNAPGTWSWANVKDLDCDVEDYQDGGITAAFAWKVEIQVTYTGGAAARRRIIMVE